MRARWVLAVLYNVANVPLLVVWLVKFSNPSAPNALQAALIIGAHAALVIATNTGLALRKPFGPITALVHTLIEAIAYSYMYWPQTVKIWGAEGFTPTALIGKLGYIAGLSFPLAILALIAYAATKAMRRNPGIALPGDGSHSGARL